MVQAQSLTATLVYTYNADGLRVAQAQSVASVESVDTFTWDWATGVPELLSDGDSLYLIGYDTLGWQSGADWTFVLPDALGSVRQETDAAGAVSAAREWSPYGEELALSGVEGVGGAQAGLGFTGEWFDANVGLQYLRARWLDVGTGRFTQVDLWRGTPNEPASLQCYVYTNNNPVNRSDPSGYRPENIDEVGEIDIEHLINTGELNIGYQYSCNCGWIDWGHALSRMQSKDSLTHRILKPLEASIDWSQYPTVLNDRRVVRITSIVNVKGLVNVPIVDDYAIVLEENLHSPYQRQTIAASIFVAHSMHVEEFHSSVGPLSNSGFSEEDLPSNLIGLYMALQIENGKGYRMALEEILQLCEVMDGPTSQEVYRGIYEEGDLFEEGWRRWDARLLPIVLSDSCRFSESCLPPGKWPSQFSNLYHRAKWAARQDMWRWLDYTDTGTLVLTDVKNLLLFRPYQ